MSATNPPSNPQGELVAAIIKGAISAVPLAGGVISEVGNLFLNPLEKRRQRWMTEVAEAIQAIEKRFGILPSELEQNEGFISFLYHTTGIALRNHQWDKLQALKAVLVASADPGSFSEDTRFQFLRYVDELTPSHLRLLAWQLDEEQTLATIDKLEDAFSLACDHNVAATDRTGFRALLQDLDSRFLVRLGDIADFPEFASKESSIAWEDSGIRPMSITDLGKSFLKFIGDA